MGDPDGVLMCDETGFVKKGQDSVEVARQYCGTLGKVENCQVGVFAAYASRHGYALVDKRLFLPEAWFTDAYATRRTELNFGARRKNMEFLTINCCNQSFRFETHLDKSEPPPKHPRLLTVHSCKSRWISRLNMT